MCGCLVKFISRHDWHEVSIRKTTGVKPFYTTIATVTINLIVAVAIVLLNLYVYFFGCLQKTKARLLKKNAPGFEDKHPFYIIGS